jgi:hypothetical protein
MTVTGHRGAMIRMELLMNTKRIRKLIRKIPKTTQDQATLAMRNAVVPWHAEAIRHMPVSAGGAGRDKRGRFRRHGRGSLRKTTVPFIKATRGVIRGGINVLMPYGIWLLAGTRKIAGGRVMKWRPGQARITSWPAKAQGGGPAGEMPIVIPWWPKAAKTFVKGLKKRLTW